jgi:putative cell wall-binding protein
LLTCTSTLSVTVVMGVATFTGCKIDTAGTGDVLTATATVLVPTTPSVASSPFNVSSTTATKLAFTKEPGNGVAGVALPNQPEVTIEDAAGRTVTTDTAPISLTITPSTGAAGAVLSCVLNPLNAVAGVAAFTGCKIDKAGTGYTLTANDTTDSLPTTASTTFNIATGVTPLPTRIFGVDAIGTAIAVSQAEFPTGGSASAVVLARSDFFSDALAGGPLAANVGGPLLITPGTPMSSNLDARVLAEIQRVLPSTKTVYILGGPLALSPTIDTALVGQGYVVVRVQGANEYATAVTIANQLGNPSTVFEATGLFFADALSAVPATIHAHGAILLTNGTTQAPETLTYIAAHIGDTRYAIGGPLAAFGADPSATPVFGADLYGTSAKVATTFLPGAAIYGAATGLDFPDALAGGVYMATGGRLGPVLLVNTNAPLPGPISGYLHTLTIGTPGFVFGGPIAVADNVLAALQAAVG